MYDDITVINPNTSIFTNKGFTVVYLFNTIKNCQFTTKRYWFLLGDGGVDATFPQGDFVDNLAFILRNNTFTHVASSSSQMYSPGIFFYIPFETVSTGPTNDFVNHVNNAGDVGLSGFRMLQLEKNSISQLQDVVWDFGLTPNGYTPREQTVLLRQNNLMADVTSPYFRVSSSNIQITTIGNSLTNLTPSVGLNVNPSIEVDPPRFYKKIDGTKNQFIFELDVLNSGFVDVAYTPINTPPFSFDVSPQVIHPEGNNLLSITINQALLNTGINTSYINILYGSSSAVARIDLDVVR